MTIEQQRLAYGRTVHVGPPKSAASRRTIAVDKTTVRLLHTHRRHQQHQHHHSATGGTAAVTWSPHPTAARYTRTT